MFGNSDQQTLETDDAAEEEVPDSPGTEKHDKEKDHKDPKKLHCKSFFLYFASVLVSVFSQLFKDLGNICIYIKAEWNLQCDKVLKLSNCDLRVSVLSLLCNTLSFSASLYASLEHQVNFKIL